MSRLTLWRGRITVLLSVSFTFTSFHAFHIDSSPIPPLVFLTGVLTVLISTLVLLVLLVREHWRSDFQQRLETLNQLLPVIMVPYMLFLCTLLVTNNQVVQASVLEGSLFVLSLGFLKSIQVALVAFVAMSIGPFFQMFKRPKR